MKRGERAMWRKLATAVEDLVESEGYAQEYMARVHVRRITQDLLNRNVRNIETLGMFDKLKEIDEGTRSL